MKIGIILLFLWAITKILPAATAAYDYQKERLLVDSYRALMEEKYAEALPLLNDIIAHGDADAETYFCAGYAEYHLNDCEKAIEHYRQAVKLQPHLKEALLNQGVAEIVAGNGNEAVALGQAIISFAPDYTPAYHLMAAASGYLNEKKAEVDYYREALRKDSTFYLARFNLALSYIRLDWQKEAVEELIRAINLQSDFAAAHYWLGQVYGMLRNPAEEAIAYDNALHLGMNTATLHYNLGIAYAELGRLADEQAQYRKALAIEPDFVSAMYNLSVNLSESGQWQEAAEILRQVSRLKPELALVETAPQNRKRLPRAGDLPEKYYQLVTATPEEVIEPGYLAEKAASAGLYDAAIEFYRGAIGRSPDDISLKLLLAELYLRLEKWTEVVSLLKPAKEAMSVEPRAYQYLGKAYLETGSVNSAIRLLEPKLADFPSQSEIRSILGVCYVSKQQWEKARNILQEAAALKSDDFETCNFLGVASMQLEKWEEAAKAFEQAVKLKPDFADGHCSLGLVYGTLGKHQEEITAYKEAIRLKPDMAEAYYGLGLAYLDIEDKDSAQQQYVILYNLDKGLAKDLLRQIKK